VGRKARAHRDIHDSSDLRLRPAGTDAASYSPTTQHEQWGPVFCGWIGVHVSPITRAFADTLGMVEPYGAIFGQPKPGSPAAKARIEAGDVITAINAAPSGGRGISLR
jgi:hypothetical protein